MGGSRYFNVTGEACRQITLFIDCRNWHAKLAIDCKRLAKLYAELAIDCNRLAKSYAKLAIDCRRLAKIYAKLAIDCNRLAVGVHNLV